MKRILTGVTLLAVIGIGVALYLGPPEIPERELREKETAEKASSVDTQTAKEGAITATIVTKKGDIVLALYPKVAPKTVENFTKLAREKFYDGILFHRVVPGFVIQAGDPLSKDKDPSNDGTGDPGYTFEDEINATVLGLAEDVRAENEAQGYAYRDDLPSLKMTAGALAMANSGPNTNGSQFFIVTESDQPHLDGKHAVFGEVTAGMDIVRAIAQGEKIDTIRVE